MPGYQTCKRCMIMTMLTWRARLSSWPLGCRPGWCWTAPSPAPAPTAPGPAVCKPNIFRRENVELSEVLKSSIKTSLISISVGFVPIIPRQSSDMDTERNQVQTCRWGNFHTNYLYIQRKMFLGGPTCRCAWRCRAATRRECCEASTPRPCRGGSCR